jgi:hypothetical protein
MQTQSHSNIEQSYRRLQLVLPAGLASELDKATLEIGGSLSAYVRRAIYDSLKRDGFLSAHKMPADAER